MPPSTKQVGQCLWQVLDAIQYLHSLNIVHRDVNTQNLLLAQAGVRNHHPKPCLKCELLSRYSSPEVKAMRPQAPPESVDPTQGGSRMQLKLADFNLATEVQGEFLTQCCGTPGFMAPEVLQCHYSKLCDVCSAGVVFYQIVKGERLWRQVDTIAAHYKDVLDETPLKLESTAAWSRHGAGALSLAQELLSLEAQGRPTAAAAMENPWLQKHALGAEQGCCAIS